VTQEVSVVSEVVTSAGRSSWTTCRDAAQSLLQLARPRQWLKNGLVVAAPLAAGRWTSSDVLSEAATAFIAFSATASGCYMINDVRDVQRDRQHPEKRLRPLAAGRVSPVAARSAGITLIVAGPALAQATGHGWLAVMLCSYALLTTLYSMGLKHMAFLEIAVVTAGFALRPIAGAVGTEIPPSGWFIAVICAGATMSIAGKRLAELQATDASRHRPSLRDYTAGSLWRLQVSAAFVMLGCYVGWVLTRPSSLLIYASMSAVAVCVATARFLACSHAGRAGAPERLLLRDPVLAVAAAIWLAAFVAGPGHA
jgi:decaprenyl-phosphate phosphoribosyltransferase